MIITLIGQSSLRLELDEGITIITDPWFESFSFLRAVPPSLTPQDIKRCDLMLVSHNHIDHLDRAGLDLAKRLGAVFLGSARAARRAVRAGIKDVAGMTRGQKFSFRGLAIHAVAADHPFASDAVGFVIRGRKTLYFSGDTRHSKAVVEDLQGLRIDAAFLQIACSWYPFVGFDGMTIKSAVRLAEDIVPGIVIPIHYQVRTKTVDPEALRTRLPGIKVVVLTPGAPMEI